MMTDIGCDRFRLSLFRWRVRTCNMAVECYV